MKRVLGIALLLSLAGTTEAMSQAQSPTQVGFYAGADVSEGVGNAGLFRIGINYSWRLVGPIEAYPGLDLILGRPGALRANLLLRVWPFRRGTHPSFWFVGAGVVGRSEALFPALVTGLTTPAPVGGVKPFVQLQIVGSRRAGAEVTAGFSVTRARRE